MRIQSLTLKNFRKFDTFNIDFHPDLTAIVALNGQGKTSILEGVAIAIGPYFSHIENSSSKHIHKNDVRLQKFIDGPFTEAIYPVEVTADFSNPKIKSTRYLNSSKSKTTTKESKELSDFGFLLYTSIKIDKNQSETLPVVCYYSSNRLWSLHRSTESKQNTLSKSRTLGYIDCLSRSLNFSQVSEWLRSATLTTLQYKNEPHFQNSTLPNQLDAVRQAVNTALEPEGWYNFHYSASLKELAMVHDEQGLLPTNFLSDGLRAVISLVADLAWRCAQLNSHLGVDAATQSDGIVLIDEVDLHLHPSWQQRIIGQLRKAFPNIQFIVTTHSPQVISAIDKKSVRIVESYQSASTVRSFVAREPLIQTDTTSSSDVMAEVFSVNPIRPSDASEKLAKIHSLIQSSNAWKNNKNHIDNLLAELVEHYGKDHPYIKNAESLIRFKEKKLKLEAALKNEENK